MYGYLDESGAPGAFTNDNDFFVVSLVLFSDKETAEKCGAAIDRLRERLKLKDAYEFHRSRNSGKAQDGMMKLLPHLDFRFITISIKKTRVKNHASYQAIAKLLVREIKDRCREIKIEMDSNPVLYAELKRELHAEKLKYARVKEVKSHSNNLIQLADYVVNLSAKKVKNTPRAADLFRPLANKQLVFLDIRD
jgi:hypothetical protein